MLRLPPPRESDPEWTNLREHDIQERWDPTIAPWVATEHAARIGHAKEVIAGQTNVPAKVLDVGCAQGTLGHLLSEQGFDVTLVDVRSSHIEYSRARSEPRPSLHFCVGLVPDVPATADFDVITCTEVIEHMPTAFGLLEGLRQKCRVGGVVYLTTPNGDYRLSDLPTYADVTGAVLAEMEVNSDDGNDHRFAYTLDEVTSIVKAAGFTILESGVFLPFWLVGYGKSAPVHRLHLRVRGRPIRHRSRRHCKSMISRSICTSLYIVAKRTD